MVDALFTSTSSTPLNCARVVATIRSMSRGLLTSASMATISIFGAILRTSSRTAFNLSAWRATSDKAAAPSPAKRRAIARPKPCDAPVMRTFLPASLLIRQNIRPGPRSTQALRRHLCSVRAAYPCQIDKGEYREHAAQQENPCDEWQNLEMDHRQTCFAAPSQ